jgi:hypothetical protein
LKRHEVIQSFIDLFEKPTYLEIGVDHGQTFNSIRARRKTGVDPKFKFETRNSITGNTLVEFVEATSDAFFATRPTQDKFNVVFIDGLHRFEQVLRDLLNAMVRLDEKGVIIIDDVIPASYHASLPDLAECFAVRDHFAVHQPNLRGNATWMGDVYRLVFFINNFLQAYSFACVQESLGQLVMWRQPRSAATVGQLTYDEVGRIDFRHTITQRQIYNTKPIAEIVQLVKAANGIP